MNERARRAARKPVSSVSPPSSVILRGRWLALARTVWLVIAMLAIAIFVLSLPDRYQQLSEICAPGRCIEGQLGPADAIELRAIGLDLSTYALLWIAIRTIATLAFFGVAWLLFWRRPREWMAFLVSLWLVAFAMGLDATDGAVRSAPLALQPIVAAAESLIGELGWTILLPLILLTFPDGRFIPRWSRWLFIAFVAIGLAGNAVEGVVPVEMLPPGIAVVVWMSMLLAGTGAQVYRYRRFSSPVQRQQTKWFVFSFVLVAVSFGILGISESEFLSRPPWIPAAVELLAIYAFGMISFFFIPMALLFSIFRYRLYDIDLLIRKTLLYALVSGVLGFVYFGAVVWLQSLFGFITGQDSTWALVISTLAIATLFNPLRNRVQNFIDRRFYRARYDAQRTVAEFAKTARDEVEMEKLTQSLLTAVSLTIQPERVSLWLVSWNSPDK